MPHYISQSHPTADRHPLETLVLSEQSLRKSHRTLTSTDQIRKHPFEDGLGKSQLPQQWKLFDCLGLQI
jgi:hypothetical protein